ncbi:MAG TPA: glycosyltransferase family 4 protein [Candidatus Saccharimonadales bacterium]|nr:glycosyltransferase family 4 protein [Candidatus Saccharimonadales bacterium]
MKNPAKTTKPTRLVMFSFGILEQGGGFENYVIEVACNLAKRYPDLQVTVVTMGPEMVEKLQRIYTVYFMSKQDPKAIYREDYDNILQRLGGAAYVRAESFKELKKILHSADVILTKNELLELSVLKMIGTKKLPPIIVGVHTAIYYPSAKTLNAKLHNLLYTGAIYKSLLKHTRLMTVLNAEDLEFIKSKLHRNDVKVIHYPFNVPPLKQARHTSGEFRLLFVGRLSQQKGLPLLDEIIRKIASDDYLAKKVKIKIAGSGEVALINQVKQLVAEHPFVEYLGHVPNKDTRELYDWADGTLITSSFETLNRVAVETALAGKVVISTDITGPREVIRRDETGFLVPLHADAFVACIKTLMERKASSPDAFYEIGKKAYAKIKLEFADDSVYPQLYNEIKHVA